MISAEHESVRPETGEGFGDSVSFAFADPQAELYGLARTGLSEQHGRGSALAVLFAGSEPAAAVASGEIEVADAAWDDLRVDGLRVTIEEPLARWRVALDAEGGGFDLEFSAASAPLEQGPQTATGRASGMEGYDQLCRVEGEVSVGGGRRRVNCLGQRGHGWGASPWERIDLARSVSAWLEGPRGIVLGAVRPAGAEQHGGEAVTAFLVDPGDDGAAVSEVAEPRLSTTYDPEGRQRRAGLELWVGEDDDLPRRAAGEVACGTTLELGRLRLDCAFFRWRMEGREGAGRYDILRRA